ncbi:MAG: acetyl-CoA carboxylase biotin carboxyl carrier protein subunit [Acidimicrobiia bacterium]
MGGTATLRCARQPSGAAASGRDACPFKVHKKAGEHINAREPLCVLEAKKMENEIRTPIDGEIVDLRIEAGDTVGPGWVLAIIK